MASEHDDLLGTEATGGDDPAETHGTITDDGDTFARSHIRPQRRVMAGAHHIGER